MQALRTAFAGVLLLALGACAMPNVASRNAPYQSSGTAIAPASVNWTVKDVRVTVPESLRVSDANVFYSFAAIVWRGDPYGDRRAQVAAIMRKGIGDGLKSLRGPREVYVDITLKRFNALTEKARIFTGGIHSIHYEQTVRDAQTGALLWGPKYISADMIAYGGIRAIKAARAGQTQKARILAHLAAVTKIEFDVPGVQMAALD